jgi:3,4-dihydroxy 2-butanone 4-phosphate synthase/GTP cyclohydrolase II
MHPKAASAALSDIEDIIADIRDGKMVIMVDDENRENEGDLLMAAVRFGLKISTTWRATVAA